MSEASWCPQCGARQTVAAASLRLCPSCLLETALALDTPDDDDALDDGDGPPFEIVTILARGGGTTTYLARGFTPDLVALRISDIADTRAAQSRIREWKPQLTAFRHPGIARLIDAGLAAPGRAYLAAEYVPGPGLDYLLQHGTLSGSHRAEIVRQLADTLDAVHAQGLAHLQVEASRIKVTTVGGVRATLLGLGTPLILSGSRPDPVVDATCLADLCRLLELPVGENLQPMPDSGDCR